MRLIWIGVASLFGGVTRYLVEGWVSSATRTSFPWGTFAVNATGSFLLGFIFTVLTERFLPHPDFRGRGHHRFRGLVHNLLDVRIRDVPAC